MAGDDLGPATVDHLINVSPDDDIAVSVRRRYRVVVGLVPDQGQGTHPGRLLVAGVIGHRRPGQQGVQVPLHPLPDGLIMSPQSGVSPLQAAPLQVGIQGFKGLERGNGHQEIAPRIAHQAFDLSLVIALAGTPEQVIEQVVGPELGKGPSDRVLVVRNL